MPEQEPAPTPGPGPEPTRAPERPQPPDVRASSSRCRSPSREATPGEMAAIMHLRDDEASREGAGYRPTWNGVLRLFNLP